MPRNKYYDSFDYSSDESSVQDLIMPVNNFWSGKPKKERLSQQKCSNDAFALVWFCFDGFFISSLISLGKYTRCCLLCPIFAIHLLPVWIWLWNLYAQ
jgi:hypothetical protein